MQNISKTRTFKVWLKAHIRGAPETVASALVILVLAGLSILGIFGSDFLSDNLLSALCVILAVAVGFLYQLWINYRQATISLELVNEDLSSLLKRTSPLTVQSYKIGGELMGMLETATAWSFRGGSGRWQREAVHPHLSRERDRDISYRMLILDPTESRLCDEYATYRNKHRQKQKHNTASSVRNDLLACIVACAWYQQNTRIRPEIYLSQIYSPLRQDMSNERAAITVADQSKEGLFVPTSSWYYTSLMDEFEQHCGRSPKLAFDTSTKYTEDWTELSSYDVRNALKSTSIQRSGMTPVGLDQLFHLTEDDVSEIQSLVFRGRGK